MPGAMNGRTAWRSPARCALAALVVAASAAVAPAGGGQAPAAATEPPSAEPAAPAAEEVYSNIQVLRGTPAEQILPTMELIAASLGVACDNCHVADAFEADDRKAKQTAREMMRMVAALNRDRFEGRRRVTCWSCHRGGEKPATEPPPASGADQPPPPAEPAELEPAPEVTAAGVFARHLEAVGGADAVRAVTTRVARGTATLFGGRGYPVEILQEAPARYVLTLDLPGGPQVSTLDGSLGMVETPTVPFRRMDGSEVAVTTLANDLGWLTRPEEVFSDPRVAGRRSLDGREEIVIAARVEGHPVELSFDRERGLLRGVLAWVETPFGRLLTRLEVDDYLEVDGLRTPSVWTVARPRGRFTVHLTEIEQETTSNP